MADILHKIEIKASRARIYDALTTAEGLSSWWTRGTKAEPTVGAVAEFPFRDGTFVQKMRIVDLQPGRRVAWVCIAGMDDWMNTEISFDLSDEGDQTCVRFAHKGWPESPDFRAHCSYRWAYFLRSLKLVMQTGKGNPHPEDTAA